MEHKQTGSNNTHNTNKTGCKQRVWVKSKLSKPSKPSKPHGLT